jgi:glucose/arabinose dehydrogenase
MKFFMLLFIILTGFFGVAYSQESTPEATPEASGSENRFAGLELEEPYTQDDLQVLVGNVQRPNGIVWFSNRLYTACNGDYTLYEIDALSGQTTTLVYGVQNAHTLYAEAIPGGYALWVPDFDTNRLLRIDHRRAAPRAVATNLDGPWGIARLNDNQFLISNIRGNNVVAVDREGNVSEFIAGLRAPAGIVYDNNTLYVVNNGSARRAIEYVDMVDGAPGELQPLVSGLQNASGLVMAADGYLYFTYSLGTRGVVGRVMPSECLDGCTNEDVEIVVYTDLQSPLAGLTISPDMRLFVHTIFRPEIYYVDVYGQLPNG